MKIDKKTPRKDVTIQGENFSVPEPFGEGHVCTANEAAALNQVLAENVRNNNASAVKKAKEDGSFDLASFQTEIDKYVAEYEFGVRRSGGRTSDPVERRALDIAKGKIKEKIRASSEYNLSDFPESKITDLARSLVANNPAILESAKQAIEIEKQTAGSGDIDLSGLSAE